MVDIVLQAKQEAAADILRRFGRIDLNAQSICFCLSEIYADYGLCTDKYGHACTPLDLQYDVEQTVFCSPCNFIKKGGA